MIDTKNMNVLIADDMENMCKSIKGILKVLNIGGQVVYAHNGLDAWNILVAGEPAIDLAIIDCNMPIMTGMELLSKIRDDRRLRDLPVIIITAEANREIVAEAAESDIDAYILKPLTVMTLEEKMNIVINRSNNPPPMYYHLKMSRMFDDKGDLDMAIHHASQAKEANPHSSRPVRELGLLNNKKGNQAEAEKWFLMAARMNELDVFAFHNLGDLYLKKGELDKASRYYEKAMTISPRNLERGMNLAKILLDRNMTAKAMKVFAQIIDLAEDPLALREEIASSCMSRKEYTYAIELYTYLVKHSPLRLDLMSSLIDAFVYSKEPKKAMPYLVEIEKNEAKNTRLLLKVARVYISIGQNIRADLVIQKVQKIEPENSEARELLKQL